ncbi:MAG: putative bifunctional diguanylate cyclase/phosphodiesterase [Actinomycetales bacterium]
MLSPLRRGRSTGSVRRLFAVYALVSLVPVLLLGAALLSLLNRQGHQHAVAEGQAKADLIARTSIAPLLGVDNLDRGLTEAERTALQRSVSLAVADHQLVRIRLRGMSGHIVYSDDASGVAEATPENAVVEAVHGQTDVELTHVNADAEDVGPLGPKVVEVYQPLLATQSHLQIGVLEIYLPYAPIAADISRGQRAVGLALTGGLLLLWLSLLAVSMSVTRRLRRQSQANAYLARHDALTGMPNRSHFADRAAQAVRGATPERPVCIAVIDLDRFKEVNDTLGHDTGDQLLLLLAERMKLYVREGDTIARLGGDEFGVILAGIHSTSEAAEVLARLRSVVSEPAQVHGVPLAVEASVGFAMAPEDGLQIGELLQHADLAMYVAKRNYSGLIRYRAEHDQHDSSTLTLIAELGHAIADDQLVLHYQPKGDVRRGRVVALEALVRWQHPTRGLVYPDAFVPAAEQTELIEDLTRWVLRRATTALPELDPTGRLAIAVNISARSLARPEFAGEVLAVLGETGTDPHRVILEITETSLMADPIRAARTLGELSRAGLRISIDDFGAGHTSLGYLATLPIWELKIDKTFVLPMLSDERKTAIVRSVIELGHSLGFTVTAEGVESAEALHRLADLDCDTVQGYLLARPVASAELPGRVSGAADVLRAHGAVTPTPGA